MNTLWNRLKYSVQADLHDLFDKKEQKNPISMLNQYIREAEKQTEAVGKLLERQSKLKIELDHELTEAQKMAEKRRNQLALAQETNEEDLITFAEMEVLAYDNRTAQIQTHIEETVQELMALERKFEEMKHKVKDMKIRQLSLMGKENALRANHRMDQMIAPEQTAEKMATVNEMQAYIENLGMKIDQDYKRSSMEQRLDSLQTTTEKQSKIV